MTGDETVVTMTTHEGVPVVRLHGDLDEENVHDLDRLLAAAAAEGSTRTVVDLSRAHFVDSSVLHALLDAHAAHERAGAVLVLAGPLHVPVRRLFEVTGTAPAFRMADSLEAAITW
ncbi:STAS domain-containing protein [Streptomyces sp. WM4235]|uniref:STAS domain-containing protein n=2 Tax=Streptomyces TaxID=1883 RepID=UPI0018FEB32C|nr:STAS domain-containing protein [Streptomyces sp. WM4235]